MASNEEYDKLFEHDFDGIQEYDNPLPGWWTWIFWGSIIFSFFYIMYFHIGTGPSIEQSYEQNVAAHVMKQLDRLGDIQPTNATIISYMDDDDWMTAMDGFFRGNCAQCHANDGGGNVGPNLCDDSYKNVREPKDIFMVLKNGVPGTQMVSWENRLMEPQMILLSSYVASLRGTTPAAPKAPEGTVIDPWPAADAFPTPPGDADDSADESPM